MSRFITISAYSLRELQAVALALKVVDRDTKAQISKTTRDTLNPIWREALGYRANTTMDQLVLLKGARVAAGNPASAMAATSTRALSGGGKPVDLGRSIEFGAYDRQKASTYDRRKPHGGTSKVTRRTRTGLPQQNRKGRVVYPAFAEMAPRMVSLWTQIIVRRIHEAFEGK